MSWLWKRRSKDAAPDATETGESMGPASAGQVVASTLTTKVIHVALIVCLALGPVGAVLGWVGVTRRLPAAAAAQTVTQESPDRATAALYAAEAVTAWLTASRDNADRVTAVLPGLQVGDLPEVPFKVRDVVVGQVISQPGGVWSVTVAVTVTDAAKTSVRRHYQIPIRVDDQGVTALTLPAFVAIPAVVPAGTSVYGTRVDLTSDAATAAGQFLTALLTGQGEVSRYVSPGVQIAPILPAPFAQLRVDEVLATGDLPAAAVDGARLQLQVSVTGTVTVQQRLHSTYWLTLAARGGRWEIASIDTQPAAAAPTDSPRSPTSGPTTR